MRRALARARARRLGRRRQRVNRVPTRVQGINRSDSQTAPPERRPNQSGVRAMAERRKIGARSASAPAGAPLVRTTARSPRGGFPRAQHTRQRHRNGRTTQCSASNDARNKLDQIQRASSTDPSGASWRPRGEGASKNGGHLVPLSQLCVPRRRRRLGSEVATMSTSTPTTLVAKNASAPSQEGPLHR